MGENRGSWECDHTLWSANRELEDQVVLCSADNKNNIVISHVSKNFSTAPITLGTFYNKTKNKQKHFFGGVKFLNRTYYGPLGALNEKKIKNKKNKRAV